MLVNFMLIGAQKSGTSSLAYQLIQHPQISFCKHKEPDYFSKSIDWQADLNKYHELFSCSPGKIYGEASTTYSWILEYPETADRLYKYNPNLKLLYIMRQPVERAISHYTHHLLRARTKYPLEIEVFENPTYINHSRYALQLGPYLERFPRENLLLIIFEEFSQNAHGILYSIADHLGIDRTGFDKIDLKPQYRTMDRTGDRKIKKWLTPFARIFPLKIRNALRGPFVFKLDSKIEFPLETKKLLWRFLQDDVQAIENIMERSLDLWRDAPYDR